MQRGCFQIQIYDQPVSHQSAALLLRQGSPLLMQRSGIVAL